MKHYYILITLLLSSVGLNAQSNLTTDVDPEVTVCDEPGEMTVFISNPNSVSWKATELTIELPQGIQYEANSLATIYGNSTKILSNSNNKLTLSIDSVSSKDSASFSIKYRALNEAVSIQKNGTIFRNKLSLKNTTISEKITTKSYNILYPVVIILNPKNANAILSGQSGSRSFKVINSGYGRLSEFYLTYTHSNSALTTDSSNYGKIVGDTIHFSAADFFQIGNKDGYLDQNESFDFIEYFSGYSCTNTVVTSTIKPYWGCDATTTSGSNTYFNQTINFKNPQLKLITSSSLNNCFDSASIQELIITNTGTGIASAIEIDVYKSLGSVYNSNVLSSIDVATLTYSIGKNGKKQSITPTSTVTFNGSTLAPCFNANSVGKVTFLLNSIAPKDSIYIQWKTNTCASNNCSAVSYSGWKADVSYSDVCKSKNYNSSATGQSKTENALSFLTETPVDIVAGQKTAFNFIVNNFKNTLPKSQNSCYEFIFNLNSDLSYSDLRFHSNGVNWNPVSVKYNSTNNEVIARFPADIPFTLNKSEMEMMLVGKCGTSGWKDVSMSGYYVPDTTCSQTSIPMNCSLTVSSFLNCPSQNCEGVTVSDISIGRVSVGLPDNNLDGLADASGQLDLSAIKLNRAIVGDTISMNIEARIESNKQTWDYSHYISQVSDGAALSFVYADVTIYDKSASKAYDVKIQNNSAGISGTSKTFDTDLSVSKLSAINSSLTGYTYSDEDSISIQFYFKVTGQVSDGWKEVTFINSYFLSSVKNPNTNQKASCNQRNARMTILGYSWLNGNANNVTVNSCSRNVSQNFGLSVGPTGGNYSGGNLFPYEYRQFGFVKEVKVTIPKNYSLVSSKVNYWRTRKTNSTKKESFFINPDSTSNETLFYNLESYYNSNKLTLSDDGFNGNIIIELAPNCKVPKSTYEDVTWVTTFTDKFNQNAFDTITKATKDDRIRFLPSQLEVSSANPSQAVISKKVSWNYQIKNSSSSASDYTWVHLDPPVNIKIDSIVNSKTQSKISVAGDVYPLGTVTANSTLNIEIFGTLLNCDTAKIKTFVGYECVGYPTNFEDFECDVTAYDLFVEPKLSAFQTRLFGELKDKPCSPQVDLTLEISSVEFANMYNMNVVFEAPDTNKISVNGSKGSVKYNMSNSNYTSVSATYNSADYNFNVNDFNTSFEEYGLPGVLDLTNNRLQLKTTLNLGNNFTQGDFLKVSISGENACADTLSTINLAYDPNSRFEKDQTAGLHIEVGNSWSGSWGDYDNDGYDDLFIPVNDLKKPNILYHNNGDGTFSKASINKLTTDTDASISATWGDYDNDGNLDLFVTNNINSPNRLYHNNGDGTFTSIKNNPIVDEAIYSHSAAWADYNKDGNLDLVVSDFHPTHYNFLFKGDGKGGFEVDKSSVISQTANSSVGASWADFDNDGDADLFIANTNNEDNDLFRNDQGVFTQITNGPIVSDGGNSMGGTWGDYDNDGDVDLFVTNSSSFQPNCFYENNGNGSFTKITNIEIVKHLGNSHGASWIDYDNDGDLDLIVANDQNQRNYLFSNNGDKTFTKIENAITADENNSYGTSWSDFDRDGDYDLLVINHGQTANDFFINSKGSCTNHVVIELVGCNSNRSAIGGKILIKATIDGKSIWQTRHISSQTGALGGQNSATTLFGLKNATSVDSVEVYWPSGIINRYDSMRINQSHKITEHCGAEVTGIVYHDKNGNFKQDSNEYGIPNMCIEVDPNSYKVYTNSEGYYSCYLVDGKYTLKQLPDSNWVQIYPKNIGGISLEINLSKKTEYHNNDFGDSAICHYADLTGSIGTSAFRRGLENKLNITIHNKGAYNSQDSIYIDLLVSEELFITNPGATISYDSIGNRLYSFKLPGLKALGDTVINLTDSIDVYSTLGDTLFTQLTIDNGGSECTIANNIAYAEDIIVGSVDPNDKLVFIGSCNSNGVVNKSKRITYKIRFQNVGTYPAQIVTIKDTLSKYLDWKTIELGACSHPFDVSFIDGVLTWYNNDIQLPDSASDLLNSNGFVSFSILPKTDIPPYQTVCNTADIQFDRNDPLRTNKTEIVVSTGAVMNSKNAVFIYPNPANEMTTVMLIDQNKKPKEVLRVSILSISGVKIVENKSDSLRTNMPLYNLEPGTYIVEALDVFGEKYYTRLIKH